jgi:hypothetical protein
LEFQYPEIKDLLKHCLTLISTSMVVSVAFAEKIVGDHSAGALAKSLICGAWATLTLALGACGIGVFALYVAGERAAMVIGGEQSSDFRRLASLAIVVSDIGGTCFGLGLCMLVGAGAARLLS